MDKIRKENPFLSEDDLKIKFSKEVEAMKHDGSRPNFPHHHRHLHGRNFPPPAPMADMMLFPRQNMANVPLPPFRPNRPPAGVFPDPQWNAENARMFEEQRQRLNANQDLLRQQHERLQARQQEMQVEYEAMGRRARLEAIRKQNQAQIDVLTAQNQARREASRALRHDREQARRDNTVRQVRLLDDPIGRRNPDLQPGNDDFAPYGRFRQQGRHRNFDLLEDPLRRHHLDGRSDGSQPQTTRDLPEHFNVARQERPRGVDVLPDNPWDDFNKGFNEFLDEFRPGNFFGAFFGDERPDDPNTLRRHRT